MNYLSNVKICTTKKHLRNIKEELFKTKSNIWNICDFKKEVIAPDNLKYVVFGWNKIEWYLNYADVFAIIKVLKEFKAKGILFKFLRVGIDERDFEVDDCYGKINPEYNAKLLNTMVVSA